MNLVSIVVLCLAVNVIFADLKGSHTLQKSSKTLKRRTNLAFRMNFIVPDVIDSVPRNIVKVKYPNGLEVNLGNELTPTSVKEEPLVEWPVEEGAFYTLSMSDPDAPSRNNPSYGEVKHWLVVNIPGSQISEGETLAAYIGSGPRKDSGLHRYVFLVYKQPSIIAHSEIPVGNRSRKGRLSFKIREFAKKYSLGEPIAGNFYVAQYDDYVPLFHSQFTDN